MAKHENTIPELDSKGLRNFGLTTGAIIAVLFGVIFPWLFSRGIPRWPLIVFAVLAVWALIAPKTLRVVYRGWMRLGLLISRITTPLILGIVFFVMFAPIGLLRRMFGWDSMARTLNPDEKSYRIASKARPSNNLENPY